jgi:hypothetical protein
LGLIGEIVGGVKKTTAQKRKEKKERERLQKEQEAAELK